MYCTHTWASIKQIQKHQRRYNYAAVGPHGVRTRQDLHHGASQASGHPESNQGPSDSCMLYSQMLCQLSYSRYCMTRNAKCLPCSTIYWLSYLCSLFEVEMLTWGLLCVPATSYTNTTVWHSDYNTLPVLFIKHHTVAQLHYDAWSFGWRRACDRSSWFVIHHVRWCWKRRPFVVPICIRAKSVGINWIHNSSTYTSLIWRNSCTFRI